MNGEPGYLIDTNVLLRLTRLRDPGIWRYSNRLRATERQRSAILLRTAEYR
jgi:hypothetical protein